jgi:hypothetical protein
MDSGFEGVNPWAKVQPMEGDVQRIWLALEGWAASWKLPEPRLSAGWIDLPATPKPLARDGWIARPMFEPPASTLAANALERESGISLPGDLRALYAVHNGSFATLLPYGTSLLSFEAMLTIWRSFARLADEDPTDGDLVQDCSHLFVTIARGCRSRRPIT